MFPNKHSNSEKLFSQNQKFDAFIIVKACTRVVKIAFFCKFLRNNDIYFA